MRSVDLKADLQRCREQHAAIRGIVEALPSAQPFDEAAVLPPLRRLQLALTAHLRLEDSCVYPALAQTGTEVLRKKALRYREQMGLLAQTFGGFYERWSKPGAIESDAPGFLDRWLNLRADLALRMESEDDDLYAIAEIVAGRGVATRTLGSVEQDLTREER